MKLFDDSILQDAIDIHIHVGPDYMPRYADAITLAQEAAGCGMRAIVVKCHLSSTVAGAMAAEQVVPGVRVIGSVALNGTTGGLNPRTVLTQIKTGAGCVWLPTVDSAYNVKKAAEGHWIKHYVHASSFGYPTQYLTITDEDGRLKEEVQEILRLCHENHVALCSGHISPQECLSLAREADRIGFRQLEITHPNAWTEDFTLPVLKELIGYKAICSLSYGACSPHNGREDPEEILMLIKELGAQNLIMMTDYGQVNSPSPVQGLRVYYYLMRKLGVTPRELDLMIRKNPARMLGLG